MSNVHLTSDLHWGHNNICKYRTEFSSEEEHRLTLKENICSAVNKRDILWILGDSVFTEECLDDLDDIMGTKYLVIGNHCAQHFDRFKLYEKFDKVFGLTSKYNAWLTHAPIHPLELRGKWCVHGHCHDFIIPDHRYINICPEHHDYKPVDLKWLRETMAGREEIRSAYDREGH